MTRLAPFLTAISILLAAFPGLSDETPWFGAVDPLSGNWRITLNPGTDEEESGILGIRPVTTAECEPVESGGCIQRLRYDPGPKRDVVFRRGDTFEQIIQYGAIDAVRVSGGQVHLTRRWNSWSWKVDLTGQGRAGYRGTWQGDTTTGEEVWQFLPATIDRVGASAYIDTIFDGAPDEVVAAGAVIPVKMSPREAYDWSEGRDNPYYNGSKRPRFRTYLYGENLEGPQHITFPNSPDFEVFGQKPLWSKPDANGVKQQIGLYFDTVMWAHARPGRHLLRINDRSFEVAIDMPGDPGVDLSAPRRQFVIGEITVDLRDTLQSEREGRQALNNQANAVDAARRSLTRVETDLQRAEAVADAAIDKAVQAFRARIERGDIARELQASEQSILDHRIRSLLVPVAALQTVRETTLKEVAEAEAALARMEQQAETRRLAGVPNIERVETADARFERSGDMVGELARLDAQIAEVRSMMQDAFVLRSRLQSRLVEAVDAASEAANDLSDAHRNSYLVQAVAQGGIQILDAAVASKGNPHIFIDAAIVQMINNAWVAPPDFSDGAENDLVTVLDVGRTAAAVGFQEGAARGLALAAETWPQAGGAQMVAMAERRAIGRWLAAFAAPDDNTPFVRAFMRAVALSAMTEAVKERIAQDIVEEEVAAYAAAQSRVRALVDAVEVAYEVIQKDSKWLAERTAERARLAEIQAANASGLHRVWPTLLTVRNAHFTPVAGYTVDLEFDGAPPPIEVYLGSVLLAPTRSPQRFLLDGNDVDALLTGAPDALDLRIVQISER